MTLGEQPTTMSAGGSPTSTGTPTTAPPGLVVRDATTDDDLDALNAGCRAWLGEDLLRDIMTAATEVPSRMMVAELDGVPVGFAHAVGHGVADGHRGVGYLFVRPEHRRRGIGTVLWAEVLAVATPDRVPGVSVQTDEDDADARAVFEHWGLVPRGLHHESALDLARVDELRAWATAPRAEGVVLASLPPDATVEQWRTFKLVYDRLIMDTPDMANGGDLMPYEVFRSVMKEPWQVMGAWRDGVMVGFTAVAVRNASLLQLNTWLTAIDREHRGLGLATALKVSQALMLRAAGWATIVTQNMDGNDAILAANRRLGFVASMRLRDLSLDYPRQ